MFRNASDLATYVKTRGVQRTITFLSQEVDKKTLTVSSLFPDIDAIIAIYDVDDQHAVFSHLFQSFANLCITTSAQFTQLAEKNATVANFVFQKHYNAVLALYKADDELNKLANTHALSITRLATEAASDRYGQFPYNSKEAFKKLLILYQGILTDLKQFIHLDSMTSDGVYFAANHAAKILSNANLLKLSALKPDTLRILMNHGQQDILNLMTSLADLIGILTRIEDTSFYPGWDRDQLWQLIQFLEREERLTASGQLLDLMSVAPAMVTALLRRAPEDVVPHFDATHFLSLLESKPGAELAIEIIKARPELIKTIFIPISNFINLIQIDQKYQFRFLDAFLANEDWSYRLTNLLRTPAAFLDLVVADRFIAYTLMQRHPQNVLSLFKASSVEVPKVKTLTDEQRLAFTKIIDGLVADRTANPSAAVYSGSQSAVLFAASQSSSTPKVSPPAANIQQ